MLIQDHIPLTRAKALIQVRRAYDFDENRGVWLYRQDDEDVEAFNIVTNSGRDALHVYGYGTSRGGLGTGFNYIAISNDATAPSVSDTTLASELSGSGLSRVLGTFAHTNGTNTSTVATTFTYSGASQAVQKTALFDAASVGVMNHEIQFTQRTLFINDTLTVTYTITLG